MRSVLFFIIGMLLVLSLGFIYSYFFEEQRGIAATACVTNFIKESNCKTIIYNPYCFTINVNYGCHTLTLLPKESACVSNSSELYISSPCRPCFLLVVYLK